MKANRKRCTKCRRLKAASLFSPHRGGLHPHCKSCRADYDRKRLRKKKEAQERVDSFSCSVAWLLPAVKLPEGVARMVHNRFPDTDLRSKP